MSAVYYFDTSALVKLYHQEAGTNRVEDLFAQTENSLIISELTTVELYSTAARKLRTSEINEEASDEVLRNFDDDCSRRFIVLPLSPAMTEKTREVLRKYGKSRALRALDALHLGACMSAQTQGQPIFICSDNRLLEIAALEGYEVLNPET